jgi:hypothetical protein
MRDIDLNEIFEEAGALARFPLNLALARFPLKSICNEPFYRNFIGFRNP